MPDQFRRSFETNQLVDALAALQPGAIIGYDELSRLAGREIDGSSAALASARRIVESDNAVAFSIERKIGVRRLTDAQIVQDTVGNRTRMQKATKRAVRRLAAVVDFNALSDSEKRLHQAHATIYSIIGDAASRESVKRIERATSDPRSLLSRIIETKRADA